MEKEYGLKNHLSKYLIFIILKYQLSVVEYPELV